MATADVPYSAKWHDELQTLQKYILSEDDEEISKLCLQLMNSSSQERSPPPSSSLPDTIHSTLQRIYCKSLLRLEQYTTVMDYCQKLQQQQQGTVNCALEFAYAHYRLDQYEVCKKMILSHVASQEQLDYDLTQQATQQHLLAQCYYRLNDMKSAMELYTKFLQKSLPLLFIKKEEEGTKEEDPEWNELLVNALAVCISNHTFTATTSTTTNMNPNVMMDMSSYFHTLVPHSEAILKAYYSSLSSTIKRNHEDTSFHDSYPYDVAYNLATGILVYSTSRSFLSKAIQILNKAESIFESTSHSKEKEEDPCISIRANKAYGLFQLGHVKDAMRMYLDVLRLESSSSATSSSSILTPGIRMTIQHNIAIIQSILSSDMNNATAEDVYKRLPPVSMDKKSIPNQIRIMLYNRILLSLKMKNIQQCQDDIQYFKEMIVSTSSSFNKKDDTTKSNKNGGGGKSINHKQQQKQLQVEENTSVSFACLPEDVCIWMTRLAMVENELHSLIHGTGSTMTNTTTSESPSIVEIQSTLLSPKKNDPSIAVGTSLDYAMAELNLYQYHVVVKASSPKEEKDQLLVKTLENFPSSIKSRPASIATVSTLYDTLGMDTKRNELLKQSSDIMATTKGLYLADLAMSMNQYQEATEMYQSILNQEELKHNDEVALLCKAKLIKAMLHIDVNQANKYLSSLDVDWDDIIGTDGKSGDELENMNIPRLSKTGSLMGGRRVNGTESHSG